MSTPGAATPAGALPSASGVAASAKAPPQAPPQGQPKANATPHAQPKAKAAPHHLPKPASAAASTATQATLADQRAVLLYHRQLHEWIANIGAIVREDIAVGATVAVHPGGFLMTDRAGPEPMPPTRPGGVPHD